MKERINK